jgi:hypothetical protein
VKRPDEIVILGVRYAVEYVDKPSDVDVFKRKSLWGQIDYWTRTIRVYDNGRSSEDVYQTLMHEILHGIGEALHIDNMCGEEVDEKLIDTLALALVDVLFRNKWVVADN